MLVEHRLGSGLALGAELGTVVAAPLERGGAALVEPAEMRHHIAGVKLVGALGRLPIGPVVRLLQKRAELALLLLQPLDQGDCIIRRAANSVVVLDKPSERVIALWHDKAQLVVVEIAEIALEAPARVLERLLAGFGQ